MVNQLGYIDVNINVSINHTEIEYTYESFDKINNYLPLIEYKDEYDEYKENLYYQTYTPNIPSIGLTPYGQGNIVDNIHQIANYDTPQTNNIEFFTFNTPAGNTFFLVVDRYNTEQNVHLLNAVTELDLFFLTYEQATPDLSHLFIEDTPQEPERIYVYVYRDREPTIEYQPQTSESSFNWMFLLVPIIIIGIFFFKKNNKNNDDDFDEDGQNEPEDIDNINFNINEQQ